MAHKCSYCKGKNRKLLADTNVVYQKWPLQVHSQFMPGPGSYMFLFGNVSCTKKCHVSVLVPLCEHQKLALLETWPSFVDVMRYYTFP